MKLVSYLKDQQERAGLLVEGRIYSLVALHKDFPLTMHDLLNSWQYHYSLLQQEQTAILNGERSHVFSVPVKKVPILAPVPHPTSCRDGYAFRQHVVAARRNRKVEMIKEFDQYPVFYFTNHNSIAGPGEVHCMPDHFQKFDFDLEAALVISKQVRSIPAREADQYIAGYMIMNDLSARTLQMEEMLLNLGPAKGKDFATTIGPWLVTPDELEPFIIPPKPNHTGTNHKLKMVCRVNGQQVSEGNMGDMDWTFAEIIERASYGVDLHPGDVIGSGTVGTGCFLELNGTALLKDPSYPAQWLQEGDIVELEIDGLGLLKNTIRRVETDYSILALKK